MQIQIKLLNESAQIPVRANDCDAGYDVFATENWILEPKQRHLFKTNISISIPRGFYARLAPRSGLAFKHGIDVLAGVIDSGYLGDVGVILYNSGDLPFNVEKGMRIAQIIIEKCHDVEWVISDTLSKSARNESGYGSTGN